MAALHDALKTLSPTTPSELPSLLDLTGYLANCLQDTHTLIGSIPTPSASLCPSPDPNLEPLQKEWKPVKLGMKENPMGFNVYKLPAKDGRGTWFARRSVHEELGFRKFRTGLVKEFEVGNERGSSVRGVGRERQVERLRCALGQIEVNYLTAKFPGPSAPRDFLTASLTSSAHPGDLAPSSSSDSVDTRSRSSSNTTDEPKPRQFTIISRPLKDHPEHPERQGYVRGQYESVEFIREIPAVCNPPINRRSMDMGIKRVQSVPNVPSLEQGEEERVGRKRGRTITFVDGSVPGGGDIMSPRESVELVPQPHPEQNPVEWIMITRSDPGGSVPRWMVERGTPGGIVKDAEKFLDWAAKKDDLEEEYPEEAEYEETMEGERVGDSESIKEGIVPGQQIQEESKSEVTKEGGISARAQQDGAGLLSSAMSTVSAGVSMLAPSIVTSSASTSSSNNETTAVNNENFPPTTRRSSGANTPEINPDYTDNADVASINSFATAHSNGPEPDTASFNSISTNPSGAHTHSTQEEKALARLLREKAKLTEKLERQRSRERRKRSKGDEREQKLLEKHIKEVEKREARYNKDIEKARRREEKKRVKELTKEQREIEELKKVVEGLTKENFELKERVEILEERERVKQAEAQAEAQARESC